MTQPTRAAFAAKQRALKNVLPINTDQSPVDLAPETLDRMESYLRNYMIADAAGTADCDDPEATLDHLFERAGNHLENRISPDQLTEMCNLLVGRIGADVLMPRRPNTLAVLGVGAVAEAHVAAALARRAFDTVRVYARQPVAATQLAKKFRNKTSKPIEVVSSPEAAVLHADAIILSTGAQRPEIDPDWIAAGAHITCVMPQTVSAHELPLEMIARSKIIASDCPQYIGTTADHLVSASYAKRRVIHLGAMIDRFDANRSRGTTLLLMSGADELAVPVLKAYAHAGAAL